MMTAAALPQALEGRLCQSCGSALSCLLTNCCENQLRRQTAKGRPCVDIAPLGDEWPHEAPVV